MTRKLVTDDKKVARIYTNSDGSANGSKLEHRIYFRPNGDRFWELQKYVKGPGYTFPNPWPQDQITLDPVTAFAAKHSCD